VVEALRAWRCFLYGSPHAIEIFTDHHSLQYINARPNLSARQCRWVERTTRSRSAILLGIGRGRRPLKAQRP
jgi:hypothetical protein